MSLEHSLKQLESVKEIFEQLSNGRHIDANLNSDWWRLLQGERGDDYVTLFKHLGKTLEIDPRGFAYFNFDDSNQKAARQVALLFLLLLDKKHSDGADLLKFTSWVLNPAFINVVREKNQDLLIQEKLDKDEPWNKMVHKAELLGFLEKVDGGYRMLTACWRFIDLYQALAENINEEDAFVDESNEDDIEIDEDEMGDDNV